MKKLSLILIGFAMIFSLVQCSSIDPKVMACKAGCDSAYDDCVTKAGKSDAKKAACEVAKQQCYSNCEGN
ncbi:MAG TPA: hypothetical protein P5120_18005 [Spirochaetota bacterium]|nr:hypothetical protein [Spirochaetota bacterium]HPF06376.1 hypothetical protein [Spirochaetota bacterium]HPJ43246.1 hypothetical protein [Spirochaetota bacterium]HRX49421.1 hypothetical protein [Spirochaetota bacterium]